MANCNMNSDCGREPRMPHRSNAYTPGMNQRPMANRMPAPRRCPASMDKADPLADMAIAMAYVPWQFMHETYEPDKALQCGTIFPELNKPFLGKGGCPR